MGRGTLIFLACAGAAGAQNSPRSQAVFLDKVAAAYTDVQSYQVEALITNQRRGVPAGKSASAIVSAAYIAPNRLRLECKSQHDLTIFNEKGVSLYRDAAVANQSGTLNDSRHRRDALAKIGLTDYAFIEDGLESSSLLPPENLPLDGRSVSCSVVAAFYSGGVKRTLWVDSKRGAVLRDVQSDAQGERTMAVRKLGWNVPLPETLFEVKPPVTTARADSTTPPVPLMRCRQPEYTEEARLAHLAGLVTISLTVDDEGMPNDIRVVSPLGLGLDESAAACLSRSRYSPAEKDGKPVPQKMTVSLGFQEHWDSDWYLGGAAFHTAEGVARPVIVKAGYPGPGGERRNLTVCLHLTVDKNGAPRDVQVPTPQDPKLDKQAISIVCGWHFQPGMKDHQPVEVPATLTLVHGAISRTVANRQKPD